MSLKAKSAIRAATILAAASALFSASQAEAGGFGGPGPFRNGSPLVTGTDGVYEAVATGKNVTGIIGFIIQGGVQTESASRNRWNFFVDGELLVGQTDANVSDGKVVGILDSSVSGSVSSTSNGSVTSSFIVSGNSGAGTFSAKIDLGSPVASFHGSGIMQGTPPRTDQLVQIVPGGTFTAGDTTFYVPPSVEITEISIPGSSLEKVEFKLRGTRLSTSTVSFSF